MTSAPNPQLYRLERNLTREQVISELAAMPLRLRQVVESAGADAMVRGPAGGEWSAFQTLRHFRDACLVYAARFRWIVFDEDPFLPNYDENNWVAASKDTLRDLQDILESIATSRVDLVRVLGRLPGEGWRRTGRHEVMGSVVLEDYARHQVAHEEMHLGQIEAALAMGGNR